MPNIHFRKDLRWVTASRIAGSLAIGFLVFSCAIRAPSVSISAFAKDSRTYTDSKVVVLPVVFRGLAKSSPEVEKMLTQAVIQNARSIMDMRNIQPVEEPRGDIRALLGDFPAPFSIAQIGERLDAEAVLFLGIDSYRRASVFKSAQISAEIIFVDIADPNAYWKVAEDWDAINLTMTLDELIDDRVNLIFARVKRGTENPFFPIKRRLLGGPELSITSPMDDFETADDRVRVSFRATSSIGIKSIIVRNNTIGSYQAKLEIGEVSEAPEVHVGHEDVPVDYGKNEIVVIVQDIKGKKFSKKISVSKIEARGRLFHLFFELRNYRQYPRVANGTDFRVIVNALGAGAAGGSKDERFTFELVDEKATQRTILKAVDFVRIGARKKDRVILYYSGIVEYSEKDGELLLVPYDGEYDFPTTKIYLLDIWDALLDFASTLILLDGCSNDSEQLLAQVRGTQKRSRGGLLSLSSGSIVSIRDCANDEKSLGTIIVDALSGQADSDHNGAVSIIELYSFAETRELNVISLPPRSPLTVGSVNPDVREQLGDLERDLPIKESPNK
ncbi:MAG: hypothetical protein GY774_35370 [Planctomycetes bacterium]|nr:hypothetical protein [Planctomycetota bacterium]